MIKDKIINQLKEVYDPEISLNVYDLGLIYDIQINEKERSVDIIHTLTTPFCGYADIIAESIKQAGYVDGVDSVKTELTFDPPFTIEMVPEETRMFMGW